MRNKGIPKINFKKKKEKRYYIKLNINSITDNKEFWRTI